MPLPIPEPRTLGLPHDTWRPEQPEAIRVALESDRAHTALQLPTGAGKSAIGVGIARLTEGRVPTLTSTKGLQTQYAEGYGLYDMRGASNYVCLSAQDEHKPYFPIRKEVGCDEGACRSDIRCSRLEAGCLYFDRYREGVRQAQPVTSYAYWLSTRRFAKGFGVAARLICDEAHALPAELMAACRIEIKKPWLGEARPPRSLRAWREWASLRLAEFTPLVEDERQRVRYRRQLDAIGMLDRVHHETWAWEDAGDRYVFEPLSPVGLLPLLGPATLPILYLSATVTPAVLALMGVPSDDVRFFTAPSRFPAVRRPVYVVPTARIDARSWRDPDVRAYWLHRIDQILERRQDRKGIVHSVSYERQQAIATGSAHRHRMIVPTSAAQLERAVRHFRQAPPGTILVSPSVTTGWDFPYTDCEYQILAKVPFPDTRARIARARLDAHPEWRDYVTMQAIVQAAGRGMRAEDDQCETFIVDDHFKWFYRSSSGQAYAPEAFREAVQTVRVLPDPPPPLLRG